MHERCDLNDAAQAFFNRRLLPLVYSKLSRPGASAMALSRRVRSLPLAVMVLAALLVLKMGTSFLPAPGAQNHQLRALEAAALSTGMTLTGAMPAMATWAEGAEPGANPDPDSTEYYNRKVLTATAWCLTLAVFLVGLVIAQARKLVENKWLN
eukprot:TRINITY_DN719_c0_g1_i1.p1 TRINITY_DN719_c0_g1~~TRINITY_DN719_c0_g1_i1.p1  ORF type:complete len:153 (-),score=38.87 TRINITY_DN719_c0_g1_i1:3-461(-)